MNGGVWNDGTNLYVQYVTTGGWVLTETHLHVATSMEGIPQNNGNPPPGQFDYASEYDPSEGVTEPDPYVIPLADLGVADPCDPTMLYIAAHAVVAKLGETQTTCVVSDNSTLITKVYNKAGGGNAEVDLSGAPMNAVEAYEPKPYPTVYPLEPPETIDSVWDNGVNWFEDNSSSADWIWDTHHAEDPASYNITDPLYDANAARWGRVVLLETDLDIPGIPTLAALHIAADNAYEFWLNSGTSTRSATAKVAGWESMTLLTSIIQQGSTPTHSTILELQSSSSVSNGLVSRRRPPGVMVPTSLARTGRCTSRTRHNAPAFPDRSSMATLKRPL